MLKYGTITRITTDKGVQKIDWERVVKGETTQQSVTYCESIIVEDTKQVLTEFLRLQDDYNAGKITSFGVMFYGGTQHRIEKTWTV